jgi:hypothetical protein
MTKAHKVSRPRVLKDKRAASPAVSMVIITAATVVMVMVASGFALSALTHQTAAAEFDTVQDSILAFDDAVRDVAWDLGGSRSVRFTTQYGNMRLIASDKTFTISGPVNYEFTTSVVKYQMPYGYLSLGNGYSEYILGNSSTVVSSLTDSFAQVTVNQERDIASIALNYRVRVTTEGPATTVGTTSINYVDIMVIRLSCTSVAIGSGDFDLTAKNVDLTTESIGPVLVTEGTRITVASGSETNWITLSGGTYMFNLVVADVDVRL